MKNTIEYLKGNGNLEDSIKEVTAARIEFMKVLQVEEKSEVATLFEVRNQIIIDNHPDFYSQLDKITDMKQVKLVNEKFAQLCYTLSDIDFVYFGIIMSTSPRYRFNLVLEKEHFDYFKNRLDKIKVEHKIQRLGVH